MTTEAYWTLDELVQRVGVALAGVAYPGAPNGRVRDLPDRRAIRWYATIGLVDRPAEMRGRTAFYGPRHLLQLVAVKRRQAQGHSLAEIQAELTGATGATLRRVAAVTPELLAPAPLPAPGSAPAPAPAAAAPASAPAAARGAPAPPRRRFWAEAPDAPTARAVVAASAVAEVPARAGDDSVTTEVAATLTAVALPGGALLLLPSRPDPDDLIAIRAAARPLLDTLAERGLLTPGDDSPSRRSPR